MWLPLGVVIFAGAALCSDTRTEITAGLGENTFNGSYTHSDIRYPDNFQRNKNTVDITIDIYIGTPVREIFEKVGQDVFLKTDIIFRMVETSINREINKMNTYAPHFRIVPSFTEPQVIDTHDISHPCPTTFFSISKYLATLYANMGRQQSFIVITPCLFPHLHPYLMSHNGQSSPYITQSITGTLTTMSIVEAEPVPNKFVITLASAILRAASISDIEPVKLESMMSSEEGTQFAIHLPPKIVRQILDNYLRTK